MRALKWWGKHVALVVNEKGCWGISPPLYMLKNALLESYETLTF